MHGTIVGMENEYNRNVDSMALIITSCVIRESDVIREIFPIFMDLFCFLGIVSDLRTF